MSLKNKMNSEAGDISFIEFVVMMALMSSLTALSIDAMLPALNIIGDELGVTDPNQSQLVISLVFLGLAGGQLIYGPWSDSIGRKPAVFVGFSIFVIGSIMSIVTDSFTVMLAGRFLQGMGLASARVIGMALIRDKFRGDDMARVMSFVMMVFILIPTVAPALGLAILWLADWRWIFIVILLLGLLALAWFYIRQPETLAPENRVPFSFGELAHGFSVVFKTRSAMIYTLVAGVIFGPFIGYLSCVQQLFGLYDIVETFPIYFALLSLSIGVASFFNGRYVVRYGMHRIVTTALWLFLITSLAFLYYVFTVEGQPLFIAFMLYLTMALFCLGLLFGNLNALAMEPLGHVAGVGAAVVGAFSSFISVPIGIAVGQAFNGTLEPLVVGFSISAALSLVLILLASNTTAQANAER